MNIKAEVSLKIEPNELGKQVAGLLESDSKAFWYGFVDALDDIDNYAFYLADNLGGSRKKIFEKLYHSIKYHEMKNTKGR